MKPLERIIRDQESSRGRTVRDLAAVLDRITVSEETLDAIDAEIESRQRDPARPVDL